VASKLGLELRTVEGFTRQGGGALGADRKIIEAVFSDEVLQERQNSPALNLGEESVVVLRVTDHKAPAQRPLEEVRADVEAGLRAEAASTAAAEAARDAVAKLTSGSSMVDVAKGLPNAQLSGVSSLSRNAEGVPPELTQAVFKVAAPAAGQTVAGSATLEAGDAAVFEVRAVHPGSLPADMQAGALTQQVAQRAAVAEFAAYVAELERTAKITRNAKVFEQ
jgi:peptidyl-prolyl cis-trans isomerase D